MEVVGDPVTQVHWPEPIGALWAGVYGTAKIHEGEPMAVLSSGKRIPL